MMTILMEPNLLLDQILYDRYPDILVTYANYYFSEMESSSITNYTFSRITQKLAS